MKKNNLFILLAISTLVLVTLACASGNPHANPEASAGFWKGLWDGTTILISGIISIFNPSYGLYEINNNGGGYDFGFFLGIAAIAAASRSTK